MKEQLEKLKAELRRFIELSKTVTPAKWATGDKGDMVYRKPGEFCQAAGIIINGRSTGISRDQDEQDTTFIVRSRNISPAMAECLLVAVEGLEWMICGCHGSEVCDNDGRGCQACEHAEAKLDQIINLWNLK